MCARVCVCVCECVRMCGGGRMRGCVFVGVYALEEHNNPPYFEITTHCLSHHASLSHRSS